MIVVVVVVVDRPHPRSTEVGRWRPALESRFMKDVRMRGRLEGTALGRLDPCGVGVGELQTCGISG